jgi:thiamine-phosphate pyrophosphorylase
MKTPINFRLIFITDSSLNKNLYKIVSDACNGGLMAIQLREKNLPANELLALSNKLRIITKKHHSKLLINDRIDIAILSGADGLHSPEHGIDPHQIKKKNKLLFGKSVHSLSSAKEAERMGFDYVIFGPVYQTPSKIKYGKPQGLGKLKMVCSSVNVPVFAVGGVNPERAKNCIEAGAHGVAVIREIMLSKDLKKTMSEFKVALGRL